jgi:hypothetical protein
MKWSKLRDLPGQQIVQFCEKGTKCLVAKCMHFQCLWWLHNIYMSPAVTLSWIAIERPLTVLIWINGNNLRVMAYTFCSVQRFSRLMHLKFSVCIYLNCLVYWPGNCNSSTIACACHICRLKWAPGIWGYNWATLPLGDINMKAWSSKLQVGHGAGTPMAWKAFCCEFKWK